MAECQDFKRYKGLFINTLVGGGAVGENGGASKKFGPIKRGGQKRLDSTRGGS